MKLIIIIVLLFLLFNNIINANSSNGSNNNGDSNGSSNNLNSNNYNSGSNGSNGNESSKTLSSNNGSINSGSSNSGSSNSGSSNSGSSNSGSSSSSSNNNNIKFTNKFKNYFNQDNFLNYNQFKTLKIWVYFNSKDIKLDNEKNRFIDNNNGEELSFNHLKNLIGLSDKAIERRMKRSPSSISTSNPTSLLTSSSNYIFETDIPVSNINIKDILECSNEKVLIEINKKSNWLNSISIKLINNINDIDFGDYLQVINCIESKSYVSKIDIVPQLNNNNNIPIIPQLVNNLLPQINIGSTQNNNNNNNNDDDQQQQIDNNQNNKHNGLLNNLNLLLNNKLLKPSSSSSSPSSSNNNNNNNNYDNNKFNSNFYGRSYDSIKLSNINKLHEMGLDGSGIKILIIDTGYDKEHQVLNHLNIVKEFGFLNSSDHNVTSDNYHGTATLSVIGGYLPGTHIGPAYNASYYLSKWDFKDGLGGDIDIITEGVEIAEKEGVDLITCSMGFGELNGEYLYYNEDNYFFNRVANTLVSKGVVFVSSAGNTGVTGMLSPSYSEHVITVGSVDYNGEATEWSSQGPNSNGIIKPDIMGLGVNISVAWNSKKNGFALALGTSFSTPLVAGGIALLLQAHPTWSPIQIHEAIISTGSKSNNPNSIHGYGIFDAYKALNYNPLNYIKNENQNKDSGSGSGDNNDLSCNSIGCSGNNGICCNDKCICADAYYGRYCQFKRVECGDQCKTDYNLPNYPISNVSVCQINKLGYPSFKCVYTDGPKDQFSTNQNPFIVNQNILNNCLDSKFIINNSNNLNNNINYHLISIIVIIIIIFIHTIII